MRSAISLAFLACCGPGLPALDVRTPHVASVDPSDGALGVALGATVTLCFDLPMQPETLDTSTLSLSRVVGSHHTSLSLSVVPSSDARCFSLLPLAPLSPLNGYEVAVTSGALSAGGVALSHASGQKTAFHSSFRTREPSPRAGLLVPAEGTVHAPLDLAFIVLAFSEPLVSMGPAFDVVPLGLSGALSEDGLSATVALDAGGLAGESVTVNLAASLQDAMGEPPATAAPLGFSYGACAEADAPSLGAGLVLPRDRDAVLLYEVNRPTLCDALVDDPACPDAGAIVTPASCSQAYDPCSPGASCQCLVALVDLCAGDSPAVTPSVHGWNGRSASSVAVEFTLSARLPALVLSELMLSPPGAKRSQVYLEVQNLAGDALDLQGLLLADCHGTIDCFSPAHEQALGPFRAGGVTVLAGHGYALLVDATFDPTLYPALPPETLLLSPADLSPLLHLASNRPQPVGLIDAASGALLSSFDGSVLPVEGISIERIDPAAPDPQPGNWSLGNAPGGTPGDCNSQTAERDCVEGMGDGG